MSTLKDFLRPLKNIGFAFFGHAYDCYRYARYSGCRFYDVVEIGAYKAVKIYHRLEKSLSFRSRKASSGWGAVEDFVNLIEAREKGTNERLGFHERIGVKVVADFCAASSSRVQASAYEKFINKYHTENENEGGVIEVTSDLLSKGKLEDPEKFFLSRYSVRTFRDEVVPVDLVNRALLMALKAPSVCNRQAWHVYRVNDKDTIKKALSLQNGNAGFGNEIPLLLIIAGDLKAFDTSSERYQVWIDGGIFVMSTLLAFHSLGVGACCLNWSKGPIDDLRIRRMFPIARSHTIITMMAVGFPEKELKLCYSARRPLDEIVTDL